MRVTSITRNQDFLWIGRGGAWRASANTRRCASGGGGVGRQWPRCFFSL